MADTSRVLNITEDQISDNAEMLAKKVFESVAKKCWQTAENSGWHGDETFGDKIALMHSELSEALEEYRNGRPFDEIYYSFKDDEGNNVITPDPTSFDEDVEEIVLNKVEGIASELADVIIRIFDDSVRFGIPTVEALFQKMLYNETRPHRHGGKKI